jgi:DNA/RNA endonuclease YhcR with UshA esterase domain
MRRSPSSRVTHTISITGLLAGLAAILAVPLFAQAAHQPHPYYDLTREVTLNGTVISVLDHPSAGMIPGSHLVLATESGTIDASLGRWGLQGKGALSVAQGEPVEVTGVMKNLNEKQVFVTRTVKTRGQAYQIRNKYGIPFSPQSRDRASE